MEFDVQFVLPMPTTKIVGGYKMVYEYSNYLVSKGKKVCIIYNSQRGKNSRNIPAPIVYLLRQIISKTGPKWFDLDKRVQQKAIFDFNEKYIPDSRKVIATTPATAIFVNKLSKSKGDKYYFVQDYENWEFSDKELRATYAYNMKIITVAKWLNEIIVPYAKHAVSYIPNGINSEIFKIDTKYENRANHSVVMLFHKDSRKGCDIGLKVLKKLHNKYPDLTVDLFGSPEPDQEWPDWIKYTRNASPLEVSKCMNRNRVFLCTSRSEGYGLTGLESMFCGCNVVTTNCQGPLEYCNEDNSIICKVDDVNELTNSISYIFENPSAALSKREKALLTVKNFDINKSKKKFMNCLFGDNDR